MPTSHSEGRAAPRARRAADECCWSRCEDCGKTCADFDEDGWCHVGEASCGCVLCDDCTNRHNNEHGRRLQHERERLWLEWLKEHYGPTDLGGADDDREVLATLLSCAVREVPERDGLGEWKLR
jgi:hypothetical protein